MLLQDNKAVIYGGSGALGRGIARAFAREGASLFLAGRTRARLEEVAHELSASGTPVETAELDALDPHAVEQHANAVAATAGGIDIAVNAVGVPHVQGTAFADLSLADFMQPIAAYARTNFITAKAVAPHMSRQGSGVILTPSTPAARMSGQGFLGYGVTCAAIEAFSRILAGELGPSGIRVVCLRPTAIPETIPSSHLHDVFEGWTDRAGTSVDDWLDELAHGNLLLGRLPTLAEVADVAAFVASDRAGAMTGAILNLTCGALVD